jgi:acyl-CoA synthetase (AMP-forming)/AMP-acid ligase II
MQHTAAAPSLSEAVERWAERQPFAPFIVEAETQATVTYGDFRQAVRSFRRELGDQPRTIVLALAGGIPAAVVWLAALTGGHRLLPCSPEASDEECRRLARSQGAGVLVVARHAEAARFACPSARVFTSAYLYTLATSPRADVRMQDTLPARDGTLRLSTSGTTGEPKGVVLSASQVAWTADSVRASHEMTAADRGLCVLPFWHINAPVVSMCATLLAGGTVVIAPRFSLHRFWAWMERERVTWVSIVPAIVALLLNAQAPDSIPASLRFARTASAPLALAHHLTFEARFGIPLIETYGLSEAASQVTANPVPPGRRKPGSVGLPVGVELRVCQPAAGPWTEHLVDVAPHATGEICVRGPSVIDRYEGGAGAASFVGGWFRTGDLGCQDDEGYVFITGRLRDVINRGGEKVAPREIEELLLAHPTVRDAAVTGEPHPIYGQRVVAYVVPMGTWDEGAARYLHAYCAQRLSAYKVPEAFYAVERLPRNGNGKLARRWLAGGQVIAQRDVKRVEVPAHG